MLVGTQVTNVGISLEHHAQSFARWGDMYQHNLVLHTFFEPLFGHFPKEVDRIVDMVDVQHNQSVQMGCLLSAPTSLLSVLRFRFLKRRLIDKDWQRTLFSVCFAVFPLSFQLSELGNLFNNSVG